MGKERKGKAASAAEAADLLSKSRQGTGAVPSIGKFSFGSRFVEQMSKSADPSGMKDSDGSTEAHVASSPVSPCIQHLSKSDARTRQKALITLIDLVESEPSNGVFLLDYWSKQFPKLAQDASKHVRAASCRLTAALSKQVGRQMGSIIKSVFSPLYFAQFDESDDVCRSAAAALQEMLPGEKLSAAFDICMDEILHDFRSVMDLSPPQNLKDSSNDEYHMRLLCQYLRGARQCFSLRKKRLSTSLLAVIRTPSFRKIALQASDSGVRSEAYTLITELALSWDRQEESLIYNGDFVRSVFKSLRDKEASNYAGVLSMILAVGRQFSSVWDFLDVRKDFYQPVSEIAFSSNKANATVEVNRTFLPLISIIPENIFDMREIAHIIAAIWRGHSRTGHLPKSCAAVQDTIVECVYFVASRNNDVTMAELCNMLLNMVIADGSLTSASCAQSIVALIVEKLEGNTNFEVQFLEGLSQKVDGTFGEDTLARMEPLIASLGPAYMPWQVSLLTRTMEFSDAFWLEKDVTLIERILNNLRIRMEKERRNGHQDMLSVMKLDLRSILHQIHPKLLNRVESTVDSSGIKLIALFIFLCDDRATALFDMLARLVDHGGAEAASDMLGQLMHLLPSDDEDSIISLRSSSMDSLTLDLIYEACHRVDDAKHELCRRILHGDGHVCLISDLCGCQALELLLTSARQEVSIDSKAIIVDILSYLFQSGLCLSDVLGHETFYRQCLAFALKTAWEEILLDCLGEPLVALEKAIEDVLAANSTLRSIKAVLLSESFQQLSEEDWKYVIVNDLAEEMQIVGATDAVTLGTMEHTGAFYRMLEFYIPYISDGNKAGAIEALLPLLVNFPEAAVLVFCNLLEDDTLLGLFQSEGAMCNVLSILKSCQAVNCDLESLLEVMMKDPAAYSNILNRVYAAASSTRHESMQQVWLRLLTKGLLCGLDSDFRHIACTFCQRHLCSDADALNTSTMEMWGKAVAVIRQDRTLSVDSGLSQFVKDIVDFSEITEHIVNILGVCHPAIAAAAALPDQRVVFSPKTAVWYHDASRGEWVPGEIISRDDSIDPPSFMVQVGQAVRETESSRLQLAQAGIFKLPSPGKKSPDTMSIFDDVQYDEDEIQQLAPVLEKVFLHTDRDDSLTYGRRKLLIFGIVHAWEAVGAATRSNLVESMVITQERTSKTLRNLCQTFFDKLLLWAQEISGTDFSDASQAIAFVRKIQMNAALQQAPKVQHFYAIVLDELETLLTALPEADVEMVVNAYTSIAQKESFHRNLIPRWRDQSRRVVMDFFSAYHALGGLLGATDAVFGLAEHSRARSMWMDSASFLELLSDAVEIIQMTDPEFCSNAIASTQSTEEHVMACGGLESLCLNTGISTQTSRVAFCAMLQCSDYLKEIWGSDADHLFAMMETLVSERGESHPQGMADLLQQCGLQREIASRISDPGSCDFHTAWGLILAYLLHPEIEPSQKELLVSLMKEMGDLMCTILEDVVGGLEDTHQHGGGTLDLDTSKSVSQLHSNMLQMLVLSNSRWQIRGGPRIPLDALLLALLLALPVACRSWYTNISTRRQQLFLQNFIKSTVGRVLIENEFSTLESETESGLTDNFHVSLIKARNQIIASLEVEDAHSVDLMVSFPSEYPLKPANAALTKYVGINEAKARKWNLSITAFLMNRNGSVGEVIQTWKRNVTKEFEGHEDCLICYSVIQPATGQLPKLACKTCTQKFHGTCLYKWFKSSSKSNCPHCQSPW